MSRHGNPYDDALVKFFLILKTECIYSTKIKPLSEARALINHYLPHTMISIQSKTKLTPLECQRQFCCLRALYGYLQANSRFSTGRRAQYKGRPRP